LILFNTPKNITYNRKMKLNKMEPTTQEEYARIEAQRNAVKTYQKNQRKYLLTSRFNTETAKKNETFRKSQGKGCIYGAPCPISKKIPTDSPLFILEMNNDTNKIMGIGLIKNHPKIGVKIYTNHNYNRYVYIGKHRIDRSEMTEDEENIMKAFDNLCFTGLNHMKRGNGLKSFPIEMLVRINSVLDLVEVISEMFKKRILSAKE
jgi:hypothetical protein